MYFSHYTPCPLCGQGWIFKHKNWQSVEKIDQPPKGRHFVFQKQIIFPYLCITTDGKPAHTSPYALQHLPSS